MKNIFLIIVALFILKSDYLNAQDFEVAPVKMFFTVDPGSKQVKKLIIKNHDSMKQQFVITTEDFIVDKFGMKQTLPKNSTKSSCADWLSFSEVFFDIEPNGIVEVDVTMTPPSGDYSSRWAYAYVQTASERTAYDADKKATRTGVNLSGRIGIQIFRNTKVPMEPKGKISELKEISEQGDNERVFKVQVQNVGPTIFESKVTFIAANLETGEEIEFPSLEIEVYPGSSREIEYILPNTLAPGEYSLAAILDYGSKTTLEGTRLNKTLIILK